MRVGAFYFPTDYGINVAELARTLEEGCGSLCVPEHTHRPTSGRSSFPGGGESDYTPSRNAEYRDGWVPRAVGDIKGAIERLRRMAEAKGRDPKSLWISVFRAPAARAALHHHRAAGTDDAPLEIADLSRDEIMAFLDRYASLTTA